MAYDAMGNYTGFDTPLDPFEEERRREQMKAQMEAYARRQEELANQVATKQEVTTYADGSQTRTIKQEMPAAPVAPVAPQMDQAAYNQRIAQMESGGQPSIGYHAPGRSTAYGTYGITNAAYQDARRMNPNLPADITQATPEQQAAAQTAFTQANAGYLQSYGVPVNENTLSAAHFLGAKGLSDYLKTGYISPQAAQANGGEENVRRIVQQRLGGQAAPASAARQLSRAEQAAQTMQQSAAPAMPGAPSQQVVQQQAAQQVAAQQPQMAPNSYDEFGTPVFSQQQLELDNKLKEFESIQNDPKALYNFEGPEWMQTNAKLRAADLMINKRDEDKAAEKLKNATDTDLARYLRSKSDDNITNRIKAMLFSAAGNKEMAQRYMDRVDTVGTDKYVQGQDGKPYLLKVKANGEAIAGYSAETGKQLTPDQLVNVAAAAAPRKAAEMPSVHGSPVVKNGVGGLRMYDPISQSTYVLVGKERMADVGWTSQGQAPEAVFGAAAAGAAGKGRGEGFNVPAPGGAPAQVQAAPAQVQGAPAQVQGAPAQVPAQVQGAPAQVAGPVVPGAVATPAAGPVPPLYEQRRQAELGKVSGEAVIKHRTEKIVPEASAGSEGSQIVKDQLRVLEDPKTDALFGLYNKSQSLSKADKNWAIVRDIISGKLETKEGQTISEDWARTNLDPDQYSAWLRLTSGNQKLATAEIKSGGFGTQISNADRISAEKMQIDIGNSPALGFYNQKAQQLYSFDSKRAKQAWAANKQFSSPDQLETEWSKESSRLTKQYQDVADERNAFIKANSENKPATPGLVREAYKRYPVPTFDPNLNDGQGGWNNPVRQRKLNQILKG